MTLYELTEQAKQLYELLSAAGEVDEQTVEDTMAAIGAEEKLEAYVHVERELQAEVDALDKECKRMEDRMDKLMKQIHRLKDAEAAYLQAAGLKKAKAGTFTLSLRETKAVAFIDESEIPAAFMRTIPEQRLPDKKAIAAILKDGGTVNGCYLKSNYSVQVR